MKIVQVDAFTKEAFKGNPAAVCVLTHMPDDDTLTNIAMEMNLSETAYVMREGDGFRLRWFTPDGEEDLCGHATLATSHVLYEEGLVNEAEVCKYYTCSGVLYAKKTAGGIELDFPEEIPKPFPIPERLEEAIGAKILRCGKNRLDIFVEIEDENHIYAMIPNLDLMRLTKDTRGIVVTAKGRKYDFVSRFFCPHETITEDPVTGSAHCGLVPFWSEVLHIKEFVAYQASKRGGILSLSWEDGRIKLSGFAVTTLRGELCI